MLFLLNTKKLQSQRFAVKNIRPPAAIPLMFVIVSKFDDTIPMFNAHTNQSSSCAKTTDDCVSFRVQYITVGAIVSRRIEAKMAPRKKTTKTASEQSGKSGRPKRTTKPTRILEEFDTNQSIDESPSKDKHTNSKKMSTNQKKAANQKKSPIRVRGTMKITNRRIGNLNLFNFTEPAKKNQSNLSADFDSDVLSSTGLNVSKSPKQSEENVNRQRDIDHSAGDGSTTQHSNHDSEFEEPPQKKKKQEKPRAPRKRKLRPEDQRTLKILSEKFKNDQNGMKCQVENCASKPIQCAKTSNLKRHLSQVHPEVYAQLFPNEISSKKQAELERFNTIQDAIELVTVNGYPFAMLSASGMQGFIKSRVNAIRSEGYTATINRRDIVDQVKTESDLIRKFITIEIKGRTISLMFDVCTITTLSMLGVNVTFMKAGEVLCRSLGIIPIEERHTAVQLADIIYNILAEYSIPLTSVFSITTDTAKNATATTDVLNLVVNSSSENTNDIAEDSIFDIDPNDDGLDFGIDIQNVAELQKVMDNMAAHTQLVKELAENVAHKNTSIVLINQINCGTHVYQLSVNGALIESDALFTIDKVHDMCILLRTQVFIH